MAKQTYIALLRGINVGGHHKVPMADLRQTLEKEGFENVKTLLNSGNVVFDSPAEAEQSLEKKIGDLLEKTFGFPIPTLIRSGSDLLQLIAADPFTGVEVTPNTRLYITFLKKATDPGLTLPWVSEKGDFHILQVNDRTVCSVVDITNTTSPDAMKDMEKFFGKGITTRNWNTVVKIGGKV